MEGNGTLGEAFAVVLEASRFDAVAPYHQLGRFLGHAQLVRGVVAGLQISSGS